MNGARKWHKANGPAFNPGEQWFGVSGRFLVTIVSVRKYPGASADSNHNSDFGVTYEWTERGEIVQHEKDCWNFQVKYEHIADRNL